MMYGTKSLREQMSRSRLQFFLYQIGGVSIGFMSLEGVGAAVRLHKLYLLPDMQGKGHGKRMLDYAQTWAREQGASYLLLNVNKYNKGAIAFYEKVGFHISKEEDIDIGSGYWMNDYQMECPLLSQRCLRVFFLVDMLLQSQMAHWMRTEAAKVLYFFRLK